MNYKYLWAKKKREGDNYYYLPLYIHLDDTSQVMSMLWDDFLSEGVKEFILADINKNNKENKTHPKNIATFLGYTHDLGKASIGFQTKKAYPLDTNLDYVIKSHLEIGGFIFDKNYEEHFKHNVIGEYLLTNKGLNPTISVLIGAHHGMPVNDFDGIESNIYKIYQTEDKKSGLYKAWDNIHNTLINNALKISGIDNLSVFPILSDGVQVIYSALLILADWIASNENYFPLITLTEIETSENRAKEGFNLWMKDKTKPWDPQIEETIKMFEERFNFKPRKDQEILTNLVKTIKEPGILIYEAQTGSGKTEAALIAAEIMAKKTKKTGVYFALPSQATSNSIFYRMKNWLNNIAKLEKENKSIRLIHSKANLNEEFASLNTSSNMYEEGVSVNSYFANRKLGILDDFAVGTIDQLLLMSVKERHVMLKHLGLSNKVLIIDEVHAYSVYMNIYLDQALKWLAFYKVPVIVLSATLPSKRRNDLLKAYIIGSGNKFTKTRKPINFNNETSYPLVSFTDNDEIIQFKNFEKKPSKKFEMIKLNKNDSENIIKFIKKDAKNNGVIGIILNTVKKCQTLAKDLIKIFGKDKVEVLHSSFISTDRIKKEDNLIKTIGKNGKRPDFKIIIGTQVIEQSLDIDFDILYTDLAPMDLLIQRMGRLHRHENTKRPSAFKNPKVYVLNSKSYDFDEGSTYIYKKYILMRTEFYLKNEIFIPKDVPNLIEGTYSDKDIEIDKSYKSLYNEYKKEYESYTKDKREKAETFAIRNPYKYIGIDKTIRKLLANSNHDKDQTLKVRDGINSIEVICLKKKNSDYQTLSKTYIDNNLARKIASQTIRLPVGMTHKKDFDKAINFLEDYYKKNLTNWDNSYYLKNKLTIIFDENDNFTLEDYNLHYDEKLGLTYKKKG